MFYHPPITHLRRAHGKYRARAAAPSHVTGRLSPLRVASACSGVTPRWQGGQLLGSAAGGNLSRGAGPTKQLTTLAGRERVDDEVHPFLFVCVNMLRTP